MKGRKRKWERGRERRRGERVGDKKRRREGGREDRKWRERDGG